MRQVDVMIFCERVQFVLRSFFCFNRNYYTSLSTSFVRLSRWIERNSWVSSRLMSTAMYWLRGRKPFLVKLLKFTKSLKAYHIIKIKLKSLFRAARKEECAYTFFSLLIVMNYMMWKFKFNFETNFLQFFKSDARFVMTAVKYLFTIFSAY